MNKFPDDFIFGAATAAYQAEGAIEVGNKGRVLWDKYLEQKGKMSADQASDFYHRYKDDLKMCKNFGIGAIRISIAWSRIFPRGFGSPEKSGVDFYHNLFKECQSLGITPFVTLHHFDSPERVFEDGDWLNSLNIDRFVSYAKFCFDEYQNEVKNWITINEPTTLAKQQNVTGSFPPNLKFDYNRCFLQEHQMNLAHAKVVNLFKDGGYPGKIGIVHAIQTIYPNSQSEADKKAAQLQDVLENRFLLDGTLDGSYSEISILGMNQILDANNQERINIPDEDVYILRSAAERLDFVGVNYYYSKFVEEFTGKSTFFHNGTGTKGTSVAELHGIGREVKHRELPSTDWDWPIYPKGLKDTLLRLNLDYPRTPEIYVTENGIGQKEKLDAQLKTVQDDERIDYLKKHLNATLDAIKLGVPVKGFFVWSLMDLFSWTNGYDKRYGLFYTDFNTLTRYPKKSAYWYQSVSETKKIE